MLETIIISLCLVLAAKRRTPRRKRRPVFTARTLNSLALSTLGANSLIGEDLFASAYDRSQFLISADCSWSIRGHTAGEGPIRVGLAHSDYSDAEIEEWLEATGSAQMGDKISREKASRKCRLVGSFPGLNSNETLNDGNPIRTKLMFAIPEDGNLKYWAYNVDSSALTTGTVVVVDSTVYSRPT